MVMGSASDGSGGGTGDPITITSSTSPLRRGQVTDLTVVSAEAPVSIAAWDLVLSPGGQFVGSG